MKNNEIMSPTFSMSIVVNNDIQIHLNDAVFNNNNNDELKEKEVKIETVPLSQKKIIFETNHLQKETNNKINSSIFKKETPPQQIKETVKTAVKIEEESVKTVKIEEESVKTDAEQALIKKKENLFNKLDKLNSVIIPSTNNSDFKSEMEKKTIFAKAKANKYKPVKESATIVNKVKILEEHMLYKDPESVNPNDEQEDTYAKMLLDKPVSMQKKKMKTKEKFTL